MRATPAGRRSGVSLIEVLIAMSLFAVIIGKASEVFRSTRAVASSGISSMMVEDEARIVLDRIALAVMSSNRGSLAPQLAPGHSTEINFQISRGVEAGVAAWNDPARIVLGGAAGNQVQWIQSVGLPEERTVVWTNDVQPLFGGELANGLDDNGNGLVDEPGLSFLIEGNKVTIRLCLGSVRAGVMTTRSVETTVAVRNHPVPTP
ncbi:MAG: prepilin-type N-terminal cleavage/methylation domain-containing protein [Planctomycetota bacterium]